MRRENHRRRGVYRASSGGWGHRAVYVGAIVASAALIAGFGAALLVYGPLGTPLRQIGGSTLTVPPAGVVFGNSSIEFASQLAGNATWNWTVNNTTGGFNGPCNVSGILNYNGTILPGVNNNTSIANLSANGNGTTTVCLNAVNNGMLNATWYNDSNGTQATFNIYNTTNWLPNGSYYNNTLANISACNNWTMYHLLNLTYGSYIPCQTYFEMNNNTTYLTSYTGTGNATGGYNNSTLWSPNQTGYAPGDVIYSVPVIFENSSHNGTYAISIDIEGAMPIAQTFLFNDSIGNTTLPNDTVLFTFDMTAAWLVDLSFGNSTTTYNTSSMAIYGSIGVVSSIVTECATGALGQAVCPIAAPVI
ncbi:MAG TPA: hypothetical protein VEH10_00030 [Thermoplasmata archaeon]|nr:hypothetical protein [Thermoplasmata archaeon]